MQFMLPCQVVLRSAKKELEWWARIGGLVRQVDPGGAEGERHNTHAPAQWAAMSTVHTRTLYAGSKCGLSA